VEAKNRPPQRASWLDPYLATQLSGVSLELALFVFLGYRGDQQWGTGPWLLAGGSCLGLIVSMTHLWLLVRMIERPGK